MLSVRTRDGRELAETDDLEGVLLAIRTMASEGSMSLFADGPLAVIGPHGWVATFRATPHGTIQADFGRI